MKKFDVSNLKYNLAWFIFSFSLTGLALVSSDQFKGFACRPNNEEYILDINYEGLDDNTTLKVVYTSKGKNYIKSVNCPMKKDESSMHVEELEIKTLEKIKIKNLNVNSVSLESYKNQCYTVTPYDNFYSKWSKNSNQRKVADMWDEQGREYQNGIAVVSVDGTNRYLVATTTTFGVSGDMVDVMLEDGTVIPCVIADSKSANDSNCTTYGHMKGNELNVLEWEVDSSYYNKYGNPTSDNGYNLPWDSNSNVKAIYNKGKTI